MEEMILEIFPQIKCLSHYYSSDSGKIGTVVNDDGANFAAAQKSGEKLYENGAPASEDRPSHSPHMGRTRKAAHRSDTSNSYSFEVSDSLPDDKNSCNLATLFSSHL